MAVASSTKLNIGKPGEFRVSSTASAGTSLTTTAAYTQLLTGTERVLITPRNFSTAVIVKVAFNPYLVVLKTLDGMATVPVDYSEYAQDNSTSTDIDLSSLSTLAAGDFLLVGAHEKFRGVYMDVDSTNSTESVTLTVSYWNGQDWVDTANTDGWSATAFDQDGLTYWTVPDAWRKATIKALYEFAPHFEHTFTDLYWTRWEIDTDVDSSVTLNSMVAANRLATYGELVEGQTLSANIYKGVGGIGCIEALTNAGTANLIVNCYGGQLT